MRTYILRRLGYSAISLVLLSVTIFFLIRMTGDPARLMVGPGGRPEDIERTRDEWGSDRSWPSSTPASSATSCAATSGRRSSIGSASATSTSSACRIRSSSRLPLLISLLIGIPADHHRRKVDTIWDTVCKVIAMLGLSVPASSWAC